MINILRKSYAQERGLTLIEMAISILLLGLITAAVISVYNQSRIQNQRHITQQRMDMIIEALSLYAETAGRLPCPADPAINDVTFGWEWNVTPASASLAAEAAPIGRCDPADDNLAGLVPFQTLNLPPHVVRDGWGRYFTYAVSPVFTFENDANRDPHIKPGIDLSDDTDQVHARCRDSAWVAENDNLNAVKARFCCAMSPTVSGAAPVHSLYYPPDTDLRIELHTDPGTNLAPVRADIGDPFDPSDDQYGALNLLDTDPATGDVRSRATTENITAAALTLISHGPNGRGAFIANGNDDQFDTDPAYSAEQENWDHTNNRTYYIGDGNINNDNPATYFDDIVLWMTQDGIMAANGTSSCQYP